MRADLLLNLNIREGHPIPAPAIPALSSRTESPVSSSREVNAFERKLDAAGTICLALCAAAMFWSSALTELFAGIFISIRVTTLLYVIRAGGRKSIFRIAQREKLVWILWLGYVLAVLFSFVARRIPFSSHPGLLWHPLLFFAILAGSLPAGQILRTAQAFALSGAVAACASLIPMALLNSHAHFESHVGLTTDADLLVLGAILVYGSTASSERREWLPYLAALGLAALMAIACMYTIEIAPALALGMSLTLIAFSSRDRWIHALALAAVTVLFSPAIILRKLSWMIHSNGSDRFVAWKEGLKILPTTPLFGFGPDSFSRIFPDDGFQKFVNKPPSSWHNDFLETFLDSGAVAAAALIAFSFVLVLSSIRLFLVVRKNGPGNPGISFPLLCLCLVWFATVGGVVTTTILSLFFWTLTGLILKMEGAMARR